MLRHHRPLFSRLLVLFAGVFAIGLAAAQEIVPLAPPQPVENDGKIEVLEFFSYACPHCDVMDGPLTNWIKSQPADVKFVRVPTDGIVGYNDCTSLFYTLEAMGELERLHSKAFDAFHREHVILANPSTLNKWLEKNGVDVKKFEAVKASFTVVNKVQRARKMFQEYKITGVPTFVVNGRTSVQAVGSAEHILANLSQVVQGFRAGSPATPAKKKK